MFRLRKEDEQASSREKIADVLSYGKFGRKRRRQFVRPVAAKVCRWLVVLTALAIVLTGLWGIVR